MGGPGCDSFDYPWEQSMLTMDPGAIKVLAESCNKLMARGPGGEFRCTAKEELCSVCGHCCDRTDYMELPEEGDHCKCTMEDIHNQLANSLIPTP